MAIPLILFFGIFIPVICIILVVYFIIADFTGAPFVKANRSVIDQILARAELRHGQVFMDLGSGDGSVVLAAVMKYHVKGIGIEINPILALFAKLRAVIMRQKATFRCTNLFSISVREADVIFVFGVRRMMPKIKKKLVKECQPNTLIIAHGFPIAGFESYLTDTLSSAPFPTYYYRYNPTNLD